MRKKKQSQVPIWLCITATTLSTIIENNGFTHADNSKEYVKNYSDDIDASFWNATTTTTISINNDSSFRSKVWNDSTFLETFDTIIRWSNDVLDHTGVLFLIWFWWREENDKFSYDVWSDKMIQ